MNSKKIIGVTGGVGSGKSVVMDILQNEYGAGIILADLVGHELMEPGQISYVQYVEEFGTDILGEDGRINHKALSDIVFASPERLKKLNEISHHNIIEEILRRIARLQESGVSFIALEAALLVESGLTEILDEMWYVYVDDATRIARLMAGRGYDRKKCLSIMERQLTEESFREACDIVIDNSRDLVSTKTQVREAVLSLLASKTGI